jgi:hypothetical protein
MRQRALIFIAAVSILQSATAQERHVFPNLNLVRSYNPAEINKSSAFSKASNTEHVNFSFHHIQYPSQPRPQFPDLQKQLDTDIRFLRIEKRNQVFQGLFQSGMQEAINKKPGN